MGVQQREIGLKNSLFNLSFIFRIISKINPVGLVSGENFLLRGELGGEISGFEFWVGIFNLNINAAIVFGVGVFHSSVFHSVHDFIGKSQRPGLPTRALGIAVPNIATSGTLDIKALHILIALHIVKGGPGGFPLHIVSKRHLRVVTERDRKGK